MELVVSNPNLSVILPVGCNAKCNFCYWEAAKGLTPSKFKDITDKLPSLFEQLSVTGGEPTLAKNLTNYLKIARKRFKKVVLNTNGFNLTKEHFKYVDHVNISRHHWLDNENQKVFNSTSIPDITRLRELCSYGDVTLNCFLPESFSDFTFILNYVKFAKDLGAKVAFRKYYNNLEILEAVDTELTLIDEHKCPACLHRKHLMFNTDVTFKYSVQETCEAINGIYELVLQSNGDLTIDWAGNMKLQFEED